MNLDDFLVELKNNKNCNFIAITVTPLHANGVDAVLNYLKNSNIKVNGYVLMLPHGTTGRILNKGMFLNNMEDVHFIESELDCLRPASNLECLKAKVRILLENLRHNNKSKDFYIVGSYVILYWSYWIHFIYPNKNIKFIVFDDGSGSYANSFCKGLTFAIFSHPIGKNYFKYPFVFIKYCFSFLYQYLNEYLLGNNIVRFTLFKKRIHKGNVVLEINNTVRDCYREVFENFGSQLDYNRLIKPFEGCALINPQPLIENKIIPENVDFNIYKRIVDIFNKFSIPVVVKPHPREIEPIKYNKFNCYVSDTGVYSQESILANVKIKPKCIISIYSSSLLNAVNLFDIPAISVAKIVLKENISAVLENLLKDFININKEKFFFPENYEELECYIRKL